MERYYEDMFDDELLSMMLMDRSSNHNIIWATDDYSSLGVGFQCWNQITLSAITGENKFLIKPRTKKTKESQIARSRQKAEVFTPSWICNKQNNLVDSAWFNSECIFNTETGITWIATPGVIDFSTALGKSWKDYIWDIRLEISCGEAPYLVSRYDTVSGEPIAVHQRIGLLDRKLRIVNENTNNEQEWLKWTAEAYKSTYGYDWQGDNVFLARGNLLITFIEYYIDKFGVSPKKKYLYTIADILSWNIWQMDGMKYTIPNCTCVENIESECNMHNTIRCTIKDWKTNTIVEFASVLKR